MSRAHTEASISELVQSCVRADRLQKSIAELATFGGREDGGVSRQALTAVELEARRYLIDKARKLGCEVLIDACANLFFMRPGTTSLAPVLTGSHVDTQPVGGRLDGAYGILAGLEVLEALNDSNIKTKRPIGVVVWTNEEGCRFRPGTMGSSTFVAPERLEEYQDCRDDSGTSFRDALSSAFTRLHDLPRGAQKIPLHAFVEAHIEQGPVLENANVALGTVIGIQGLRWYNVECTGIAAHAGTTPMDARSDAMTAAIIVAQQLIALPLLQEHPTLRLTLGHWIISPNSINTIPDYVQFSIDVRSSEDNVLASFEQSLDTILNSYTGRCKLKYSCVFARRFTRFPEQLLELVDIACLKASSRPALRMISGAFHDAMYLADHCPTCMIFVPSKDGISHNAAEYTSNEHLYLGARALAYVVTALAFDQ